MLEMVVTHVVSESDRVLLYGEDKGYHVIAKRSDDVKAGDTIEYEPYGINFGWFEKVISRPQAVR